MAKKQPHYFDTPHNRKLVLGLPSGVVARFYRGRPELNPITDERDIIALRRRRDLVEVQQVTVKKELVWVDAARADEMIAKRIAGTTKEQEAIRAGAIPNPVTAGENESAVRATGIKPPQPKLRRVVAAAPAPKTPEKPAVAPLDDRIANIMLTKLDPDNSDHFTTSGKPQVAAIEELLGENITAKDRDRVWAEVGSE